MQLLSSQALTIAGVGRDRCYRCYRPRSDCYCAVIPAIDNRTEVLILQHMRERFHPFNTARIVHQALRNSRLLADHTANLAKNICLKPEAGLLYPVPSATLLVDLPADRQPKQLVVLDGTWHHAKTLLRDIPALHSLPRYQLAPSAPSRYRIRLEPSSEFLSTVEATVAALRILEPGTQGLDQLLRAFDEMVERQLAHPKSADARRRLERRDRTYRNIPRNLLGDLSNVVVAYGEAAPSQRIGRREPGLPVYWVAHRLGTEERFACMIRPKFAMSDAFLGHLELSRSDFSQAMTAEQAQALWGEFLRPEDTVAVYNQGSARLLHQISPNPCNCLVLKSVDFHPQRRYGTLDEIVSVERLSVAAPQLPGRAERRLAMVEALVRFLNALANASIVARAASLSAS